MKRSLEITLKSFDHRVRQSATENLEKSGIEIAESRQRFIQVRSTTPTEIRRVLKGVQIASIRDGFRS